VTLASLFGVLSLCLFYFHHFPGLFLVSNLLIVHFLGIILGVGVFVIIWSSFSKIPIQIVEIYGGILEVLQKVVSWVAEKDNFLFQHIYFSSNMLILSFLMIGIIAAILHLKSKLYIFLLGVNIIIFQLVYLYEFHQISSLNSFYIFIKIEIVF